MSLDQHFDGSDAHLLPDNAEDCAAKLRQYNRWRRGEDWGPDEDGPNPKELGLLIDYAAYALEPKACCGEFETCEQKCSVRADRFKSQRDELLAAAEAIETYAEECLDFDECTAIIVPIDTYHKLMEAIASVKGSAA